jgi:hypothetical protein
MHVILSRISCKILFSSARHLFFNIHGWFAFESTVPDSYEWFDFIFLIVIARDALHDRRLLKRLMMRTSGEDVNSLRLIVSAGMMWNARHC